MRKLFLTISLCIASLPCLAAGFTEVATNWNVIYSVAKTVPKTALQVANIQASSVQTSCGGFLLFPDAATMDDIKEFFHLVTTSKLSGLQIKVNYTVNPDTGFCTITNFGPL